MSKKETRFIFQGQMNFKNVDFLSENVLILKILQTKSIRKLLSGPNTLVTQMKPFTMEAGLRCIMKPI